jgi:hypothetical protein
MNKQKKKNAAHQLVSAQDHSTPSGQNMAHRLAAAAAAQGAGAATHVLRHRRYGGGGWGGGGSKINGHSRRCCSASRRGNSSTVDRDVSGANADAAGQAGRWAGAEGDALRQHYATEGWVVVRGVVDAKHVAEAGLALFTTFVICQNIVPNCDQSDTPRE